MVFDAFRATLVVENGYTHSFGATGDEKAAYKHMVTQSLLLLIQGISHPIKFLIGRLRSAHNIWQHLHHIYFQNSSPSFVNEINAFHSLSSSFSSSKSISNFLDQFDIL